MGLEDSAKACKVIVSLYSSQRELGMPSVLPVVYTEETDGGNTAVIGAKQPFPK